MTSSVVLFFFFLLSCVGSTSTMPGVLTGQHSLDFPISWELPWNQTSVEHRGFLEPPTPPAKTEQYVERTYSALALGLWELLLSDTQKYCQEGDIILQHSWQYACETFNKTTLILFEGVLELLIRVWSFVIFAIFYTAWRFITQWTMHALLLLCLGLLTKISIRTLRFVLGDWLVSLIAALIVAIIKLPWTCFKTVFFKPFSGIKPEMAVKGFVTHDIHMKPPRDSQLLMAWDDGSHAGYATCIRLYNGTNALVTAAHCRKHEGFVVSTKTKNRIPINAFKPLCVDVKNDFALFEGPMEWESLLGCKAVAATPMYLIRKGSASHYRYVNGEWFQRYAQIGEIVSPAHSNKYALQVLSNTDEGDSGAGYFVGKNLVGIHLGASLTDNHNAMLPILPIPGLTIPDYQLETTAPEGKVFTSSIYEEALKATERTMKFIANLRSKGKEVWSDLVDDLDFDPEAAPRVHPESSAKRSGKRQARHRPRTNRQGRTLTRLKHPYNRYGYKLQFYAGSDCKGGGGEDRHRFHRESGDRQGVDQDHQAPAKTKAQQAEEYCAYFASLYRWSENPAPSEAPGFKTVGRLPKYYFAKQKGEPEFGRELVRKHPYLATKTEGFGWPQFGAEAELTSLILQAGRWRSRAAGTEIPSSQARERVINRTVQAYQAVRTPCPIIASSGKLEWSTFLLGMEEAIRSLELDAGVGVPYISLKRPTHRGMIEDPQLLPVVTHLVFSRLQKMLEMDFESMTPVELVQNGLCDPIRLFVKGEPHKKAKLEEGRYRLIMSVSLVDQLVARLLFQDQNKREIELWRAVPSKPGFGLSTDSQVQEFVEVLARQVGLPSEEVITSWRNHLIPTDCSGFDWSVQDWMLQDEMEVRNRLTLNNNDCLRRLRSGWLKCLSNSVLCLSDGTLLSQEFPGIQKSGSYNTSSSNSRIRVMCAFHTGASWCMAMGDDALESVDGDLSRYSELGLKVERSEQLEFCSHIFESPSRAIPVNANKMLYKLIYGYNPGSGNVEVITNYLTACLSILNELRHDPSLVEQLYRDLFVPVEAQKNSGRH
ncbi:P1-P2 fusion protein [Cowpea polerovirus 1]|uniref:p1-P2 fusion protein n=9 Tax=Cowpea polerovirus 1 TaxID=1913124 RepID=A0A1I9W790_9VIRU|nr:P1-P2 fusion protein [Cowpea polerovirus 1]APA23041.1 P1-P2 fusion protein [Cowpea polerovirus 1]AQV03228.1 P1-P2 fusion protein [Cowpea polerovirus 1]